MGKSVDVRNGKATKASEVREMLKDEVVNFLNNTKLALVGEGEVVSIEEFRVNTVEKILNQFFNGETKHRGLACCYYIDNMPRIMETI